MALEKTKRYFDYKDRIGVSRGGDFDTLQSYSAREAQQLENLFREQSSIAYKEAVEKGEERGLLAANTANTVYDDVSVVSDTGESYTVPIARKYQPPAGLTGKTALKVFKEQTHKRYITELTNSTTAVIGNIYSQYADKAIDGQTFNDLVSDALEPIYSSVDPETRNLLKLKDQTEIINKGNYLQREFVRRKADISKAENKKNTDNIEKNAIRSIVQGTEYDSIKQYNSEINSQLERRDISPDEAKFLKESYKDKIDSLTKLDGLTKKMFPRLGTDDITATDLTKLDEYQKFLEDNTRISFEYNGVTITKDQINKSLGKNKEDNLKTYRSSIKQHQTTSATLSKKAKNESILTTAIEQFNSDVDSGGDGKYRFGQGTGKQRRTFAAENEQALFENWMSRQDVDTVSYNELSKNQDVANQWMLHKLKHGLINNEQYNTLIDKINSSNPDDVVDLFQDRTLEFMVKFSNQYDHNKEDQKLIDALYSRLEGKRPGQAYSVVEQYLKIDKKVEKRNIVELLSLQPNEDYQKAKHVNKQVSKYLVEIVGDTASDDVMFSTIATNRILSNIYDNIDAGGLILTDDVIKTLVRRELATLDDSNEWGYSRFGIAVSNVPVKITGDVVSTFAKYPPEKNYPLNYSSQKQINYTYQRMTDKFKVFLNRKQNENIKALIGKANYGTADNPNLKVRARLKDNNEVEYILVYDMDGMQITLEDENNRVLTFDSNDFEQNILQE